MMAELNESADIFANSSTETVRENEYMDFKEEATKGSMIPFIDNSRYDEFQAQVFTSSPMSPINYTKSESDNISFITNQFISEACNVSVIFYCPFCPFTCHFEFIFKDHIKNTHPGEIISIAKSNSFYVEFHACPFCHAKFYTKDLLPKHVLTKHQDSVVFTGVGHNNYAQCRFCSFKLFRKHLKRLIVHVEKKHMSEFYNFLKHQNTSVTLSSKDLKMFCDDIEELSSSVLNTKMDQLSTQNRTSGNKTQRVKSILKPPQNCLEPKAPPNNNIHNGDATTPNNNGSYEAIRIQNSARRKLRFDLPASVVEDKENKLCHMNVSSKEKRGKIKWFSLFQKEKRQSNHLSSPAFKPMTTPPKMPCDKTTSFFTKFHLENDGVSPLTTNQFKCGLCHMSFENNAQLLNHLQTQHKGLNLSAQYRCGACNAKFYRNSFLVRHCWFHHTPLCLKKTGQLDDAA